MKKNNKSKAANLRQKAEELLIKKSLKTDSQLSETDILKLIHEFEVHKIELEMQNEELRLANEQAEIAAKKYTNLYDFAPSGYFILSKEGKVIDLNLSGANMLGKERSLLINSQFGFFVSNDTKPIFTLFLSKVFNSKAEESCEIILSTYGNLPMYVSLNGIVTENSEQCFVNGMNITDGKRSAELIIANKKLVFQNDEKEKRAAELILANKELAFQNDEKEKRAAELVFANKELAYQNKEKGKRADELIILNNVLDFQNKEREKQAKELILANEAILQSEENFHRSISESSLGIRIVSVDGETIYANKAFLDIFEFNKLEEFTSTPAINRYTPESYSQRQERKEKRNNGIEIFDYEVSIIRKNAEIRHIKVSRKEVLWNGNKHYQLINIDITEQKKLTIDLIAAKERAEESDRLKSAFLTNMSHEIRTPMNGILGFTELLKTPNLSSDDQQDFIQTIQISGARMLNTINSIVAVAKIESGLIKVEIKETNINEKIEFIYKFFKPEVETKGLQFLVKTSLPSKEVIIETDSEKVYGILTNLVKNAIKFTFEGSIEFGYEKKGEYLEFFVKDTGVGIPKNQKDLIFERFRQGSESHNRGYEGSGLGLSIAKSYVEMLGGEIWVESEEDNGSTFYFTIPYIAVSEEKTEIINAVSSMHKEVQLKNLKILIVEDDEISYSLLTKTLQKISYEVLHAITGVQAVEACRNNPDIDLVLMDIR
ncbi:MAG: PAS domain S-box protein, partial [Bacteroidetes bacterium]|nr:PAS domain S-box protein [Bacteroidota bacterium]